jgi:hypothetical protein
MTYSGLENKERMTQHEGKRNSVKRIYERAGRHAASARLELKIRQN